MPTDCSYPSCPSGLLNDERHSEVKQALIRIEGKVEKATETMSEVAALSAHVDNIKKDLETNSDHHKYFFTRLRVVDKIVGGAAVVVVLVEVLKAVGIIK